MADILFCNQSIDLPVINVLFPNVNAIEIKNINISNFTMRHILGLISQNHYIPQITIKNFVHIDKSELQRICNRHKEDFEKKHFRLTWKCNKKGKVVIEQIVDTEVVVDKNKNNGYSDVLQGDNVSSNTQKKSAGYRLCFEVIVALVEISATIVILLWNANILINSSSDCHQLAVFTAVLTSRNVFSLIFFCCNYHYKNGERIWFYHFCALLIHVILLSYGFWMLFAFEIGCKNTNLYLWYYCYYLMISIAVIQTGYGLILIFTHIAVCLECLIKCKYR
eukprot:35348_1